MESKIIKHEAVYDNVASATLADGGSDNNVVGGGSTLELANVQVFPYLRCLCRSTPPCVPGNLLAGTK